MLVGKSYLSREKTMKDGIVRVGAVSPKIRVADIGANAERCIRLATEAAERGIKILVFPELTLTGATAGDLFYQRTLYEKSLSALSVFAEKTAGLDILSFIGLPIEYGNKRYNAVAAVSGGKILGVSAKQHPTADERRYFAPSPDGECEIRLFGDAVPFGSDIIYRTDSLRSAGIAVEVGSDSALSIPPSRYLSSSGANVIVNPASVMETVGEAKRRELRYTSASADLSIAYIVSEAGIGESGTDGAYAGRCAVYEAGELLARSEAYTEDEIIYSEIDTEALSAQRRRNSLLDRDGEIYGRCVDFFISVSDTHLSRRIRKSPFIPDSAGELSALAKEIIEIQSQSLAGRIERSYSKGAVIGVSGGLDSTLALLVAVRAMDILKRDRKSVIAVTMPCFGTTERTKGNAERLAESLGTTLRCIDIKASVTRHFEDIGQDADNFDVVYENAQARERTQVLMDIANMHGALVVGTGDLSELALGWATYNGDHMSMYSVNGGIPKTLMRYLVSEIARQYGESGNAEAAGVLRDVLDTPVSPELLPPKDGEIAQCTEGIVGPYELHDFFLYYFIKYGFSPKKILRLALAAFADEYDADTVRAWLTVFLRRFFSQQFKRSCLPDGPKVLSIGVSPRGELRMPSDAVGREWLDF